MAIVAKRVSLFVDETLGEFRLVAKRISLEIRFSLLWKGSSCFDALLDSELREDSLVEDEKTVELGWVVKVEPVSPLLATVIRR